MNSGNSEKLADHIKFLNFTIAVFCVGIISLFVSDKSASFDCKLELKFIGLAAKTVSPANIHKSIVARLPPESGFFDQRLKIQNLRSDCEDEIEGQKPIAIIQIGNDDATQSFSLLIEDSDRIVGLSHELQAFVQLEADKPIENLNEFKQAWNLFHDQSVLLYSRPVSFLTMPFNGHASSEEMTSHRVERFELLSGLAPVVNEKYDDDSSAFQFSRPRKYRWSRPKTDSIALLLFGMERRLLGLIESTDRPWPPESLDEANGPKKSLMVEFTSRRLSLGIQSRLLEAHDGGGKFSIGTFATSFPEIEKQLDYIGGLTFDAASRVLEQQAVRELDNETLSLAGLTIQKKQIRNFGLGFLIALQFYLALHTYRLKNDCPIPKDTTWIGCYPYIPAVIIAILSACVLPAGVGILLLVDAWASLWWQVYLSFFAILLFLCVYSGWHIYKIWNSVKAQQSE